MRHMTATETRLRHAAAAARTGMALTAINASAHVLVGRILAHLLLAPKYDPQRLLTYTPKVTVLPYMGKPKDPKRKDYVPLTVHTDGVIRKRAIIVESDE